MNIPKNDFDVKSFEEKKIKALTTYWINNLTNYNIIYLGGLSRFRFDGTTPDIDDSCYDFCPTEEDMIRVCKLFKNRGYYCYRSPNKVGIFGYGVYRKPMSFGNATLM